MNKFKLSLVVFGLLTGTIHMPLAKALRLEALFFAPFACSDRNWSDRNKNSLVGSGLRADDDFLAGDFGQIISGFFGDTEPSDSSFRGQDSSGRITEKNLFGWPSDPGVISKVRVWEEFSAEGDCYRVHCEGLVLNEESGKIRITIEWTGSPEGRYGHATLVAKAPASLKEEGAISSVNDASLPNETVADIKGSSDGERAQQVAEPIEKANEELSSFISEWSSFCYSSNQRM